MSLFIKSDEKKLKELKEHREQLQKKLEILEEIDDEEKALASEEKRLKELTTPKWLKKFLER
jgi:cell shape-determining protein MreC